MQRVTIIEHRIPFGNKSFVKQPIRKVPVHILDEINKQLDMIQNGIIQSSKCPWASGVDLFKKKDGTQQFCIKYNVTMMDVCPLLRTDVLLEQLSNLLQVALMV